MMDPEFRKEYELLEPEYKLAAALIRLRLAKGLTQASHFGRLYFCFFYIFPQSWGEGDKRAIMQVIIKRVCR